MYITHSYLGTTKGKFRCLFFLLLEDYIEAQSRFVKDLDLALERFARKMKDCGVLLRPFTGDIESTRSHILDKPWTDAQKSEIYNTPGLLMIEEDFDTFDPRKHRWLFFSFGSRSEREISRVNEFAKDLAELAEAVCDADTDVFQAANAVVHEVSFRDAVKLFEAKPGVFGFSIDLIRGAEILRRLYLKLTKGQHILTAKCRSDGWTCCPKCSVRFTTHNSASWDGHRHITCGTYLKFIPEETPNNALQ